MDDTDFEGSVPSFPSASNVGMLLLLSNIVDPACIRSSSLLLKLFSEVMLSKVLMKEPAQNGMVKFKKQGQVVPTSAESSLTRQPPPW